VLHHLGLIAGEPGVERRQGLQRIFPDRSAALPPPGVVAQGGFGGQAERCDQGDRPRSRPQAPLLTAAVDEGTPRRALIAPPAPHPRNDALGGVNLVAADTAGGFGAC